MLAYSSRSASSEPAMPRVVPPAPRRERARSPLADALFMRSPRVSHPGDALEREADQLADTALRSSGHGVARPAQAAPPAPRMIQRQCAACASGTGGACPSCEEERADALLVRRADTAGAPPAAPAAVAGAPIHGLGRPLEPYTRAFFEPRFGFDFGHVRVHDDARAAESAAAVQARAYTLDADLVFARGRYDPESPGGRELLAHELAHVVQQSHGGARLQRRPEDDEARPADEDRHATQAAAEPGPCPSMADGPDRVAAEMRVRCISQDPAVAGLTCRFTPAQAKALAAAKALALERVRRARSRLDAGPVGRYFALDLARKLFVGRMPCIDDSSTHPVCTNPGAPPRIATVLARLEATLASETIRFEGASCHDEQCERAIAYVTGPGQMPIHICPRAFLGESSLVHTVIHEAVHIVGIDVDESVPESYCRDFDCETPCRSAASADAWAHFIDCLGEEIGARRSEQPWVHPEKGVAGRD